MNSTFILGVSDRTDEIFMASTVDTTKTVYIIVHGKKDFVDQVKEKLAFRGFEKEKMQNAQS